MKLPRSNYKKTEEKIFLDVIINEISEELKIPIRDLKSKSRKKHLVKARCIYFALSYGFVQLGVKTLSKHINKNHSTLYYGIEIMEDMYFTDKDNIRKIYRNIFKNVEEKRGLLEDGIYKCPICNGKNIQIMAMVDINTKEIIPIKGKNNEFCMDCKRTITANKVDLFKRKEIEEEFELLLN